MKEVGKVSSYFPGYWKMEVAGDTDVVRKMGDAEGAGVVRKMEGAKGDRVEIFDTDVASDVLEASTSLL